VFVKVPEEKEATEFKMAEIKSGEFVCTNDSIDFPKQIHYWMDGKKMKATISNEKMEILFEFEKIK
jgi:galactokinase/mevalonate kinase-like predicted kinase